MKYLLLFSALLIAIVGSILLIGGNKIPLPLDKNTQIGIQVILLAIGLGILYKLDKIESLIKEKN